MRWSSSHDQQEEMPRFAMPSHVVRLDARPTETFVQMLFPDYPVLDTDDDWELGLKRVMFRSSIARDAFLAALKFSTEPVHVAGYFHYYSDEEPLRMTTTTNLRTGKHANAGTQGYPIFSFDSEQLPYTHYMSLAGTRMQIEEAATILTVANENCEVDGPLAGSNGYISVPPPRRRRR